MIKEMRKLCPKLGGESQNILKTTYKFLEKSKKGYNNQVIIDYRFGNYIREYIDAGLPIVLSFNWTIYFEFRKENSQGIPSSAGCSQEHAVAVRGYNQRGVHVVDSHYQFYKGRKRKKYRNGMYLITWEQLMTCMGCGDLILPSDYNQEWLCR